MAQTQPKQAFDRSLRGAEGHGKPPQLGVAQYRPLTGTVRGKGTPTSDSIPAKLSKNEVVLNAGAAQALQKLLGKQTITQFNAQYAPEGAKTGFKGGMLHAGAGAKLDEFGNPKYPPLDWQAQAPESLQSRVNNPDIQANAAAQANGLRESKASVMQPENLKVRLAVNPDAGLGDVMGRKAQGQFRQPLTDTGEAVFKGARSALGGVDNWKQPIAANTQPSRLGTASMNLKTLAADPVNAGLAGDTANQALLDRSARQGNPMNIKGKVTGGNPLTSLATRGGRLAVEQLAGGIKPDSPYAKVSDWANKPLGIFDKTTAAVPQNPAQPASNTTAAAETLARKQPAAPPTLGAPNNKYQQIPIEGGVRLLLTPEENNAINAQDKARKNGKQSASDVFNAESDKRFDAEMATRLAPPLSRQEQAANRIREEEQAGVRYRDGLRDENAARLNLIWGGGLYSPEKARINAQALTNESGAAHYGLGNRNADIEGQKANEDTRHHRATEMEVARQFDLGGETRADKPAFNEEDLQYLDANTPDDERLAASQMGKRPWNRLKELYLSTDQPEERSKYIQQLSQLSGISTGNIIAMLLKK